LDLSYMKERAMPLETQTLPGEITRGQGGEKVADGWCLIAYETTGRQRPLSEWRGEMAMTPEVRAAAVTAADDGAELYLTLRPYGGVTEPWHGPVTIEPVSKDDDPEGRRLRLRSAGALTRSYAPMTEEQVSSQHS
jgi:hypothetical protein